MFPLGLYTKEGYTIQHNDEVLASAIKQDKEIKAYRLKRKKLSLFADDMFVYIGYPKESTKKLLELISEFSMSEETSATSKKINYISIH